MKRGEGEVEVRKVEVHSVAVTSGPVTLPRIC